jgi:NodT family efflux transporter outer membrane factor (OMF) lipoprotein
MRKERLHYAATALGLSALAGCNFAPHYDAPKVETPAAFKEAVPGSPAAEGWTPASPKDAEIPAHWWELYGDPDLDDLESRVAISNQSVAAAAASYRAARALTEQAQAAFFPTLGLDPSVTRSRTSQSIANLGGGAGTTAAGTTGTTGTGTTGAGTGTQTGATGTTSSGNSATPHTIYTVPLEFSYQVDLWGSVRNTVAQDRYAAQASAAQVVTALLSTQSTLAQDYFQLRALDEQRRILDSTLADYEASIHLIETLKQNGIDSDEDMAEAENQLYTAEAEATDLGVARAQYEHAIAVLIGVPPAKFSLALKPFARQLPRVPLALPSSLLERRADIAAAERQVAASNAQIGVARAAFFPSLTLSASGGYEATAFRQLFDWPNRFWSLGPDVAQTLFDGGARSAAVRQAHAQNDEAAANYRQTVLAAFQSVEDNLASLRVLAQELAQRHKATVAAQKAVELSVVRFKNGVDSYINVITAQNTFLSSRQAELQVQLEQQIASVNLVGNLGGGWTADDWAATEHLARQPRGQAGQTPAADDGGVPNPPRTPTGDIKPEEILEQNAAAMAPAPPGEN